MTASKRDALVARIYSCVEAGLPARIDDTFSLLYEVERLTRERDAERQAREVTFGWYDELRAEVLRLTAEVERLREDAKRMDWLVGSEATGPSVGFNRAWRIWDGSSDFRAAIDAARTTGGRDA